MKSWGFESAKSLRTFQSVEIYRAVIGSSSFWLRKNYSQEICPVGLVVVQSLSCPTLCDPMNCSTPDFPVLHYFLEFAQTYVLWVNDAIQSSHPLLPPSPPVLQESGSFTMSQLFASGGQSIGASASASVLPMNNQGWFPLGLTGWISLQSQ